MKKSTELLLKKFFVKNELLVTTEKSIFESAEIIIRSYRNDCKLLVCGNGGSAADCEHIVGELMKNYVLKRNLNKNLIDKIKLIYPENAEYLSSNLECALPVISLVNNISFLKAFINDNKSNLYYAQQVLGYGKKGDTLFAITTSGNSENVIFAAQIAKVLDMKVIALTGCDGGRLKKFADIAIIVPFNKTFEIQEYHQTIYHVLCMAVENEFFSTD